MSIKLLLVATNILGTVAVAQLPQIARLEKATVDLSGWKTVVIRSASGQYVLGCDVNQITCVTPETGKGYYVIDRNTKTTLPGASAPITLEFLEGFFISYNNGENIALLPAFSGAQNTVPGIYRSHSIRALNRPDKKNRQE